MSRMYTVSIKGVVVSAAQDLLELTGAAGKLLRIHEIKISQSSDAGDAQSEQLQIVMQRLTGGYTSGSGGSAPTPRPLDPGSPAASFTAEINNTTQASGGTAVDIVVDSFNVLGPGWHYLPVPECRPVLGASSAIVVSMPAPADAITVNGYIKVEELG